MSSFNSKRIVGSNCNELLPNGDGSISVSTETPGNENILIAEVSSDDITPGTPLTVINETVPAGKKWTLTKADFTCRQPGILKITQDDDIIGTIRLGPGNFNGTFKWSPTRTITAGAVLEAAITIFSGHVASDCEVYIHYVENPA